MDFKREIFDTLPFRDEFRFHESTTNTNNNIMKHSEAFSLSVCVRTSIFSTTARTIRSGGFALHLPESYSNARVSSPIW
jgi:hypothetical protein